MLRSNLRSQPKRSKDNASKASNQADSSTVVPKDSLASQFPDATLASSEPKVLVPFEHQRGRVPRRIEVERQRRLYAAQDVEELIKLADLQLERSRQQLPLEIFDDTSFECRNPEEWMSIKQSAENAESRFLPAQAIRYFSDTEFKMALCRVVDWNEKSNQVRVIWGPAGGDQSKSEAEESDWTPRIFVHLLAEDPVTFVQRLVCAHEQRVKTTAWIKYRLCCDSKPVDGLPGIDPPVMQRIMKLGSGIPQLSPKEFPDVDIRCAKLIEELALEWRRTHNRIALEHRLAADEHVQQLVERSTTLSAVKIKEHTAALKSTVQTKVIKLPQGGFNFADKNENFTFSSYYTQPQVVGALTGIRNECIKVLDQCLFNIPKARQMSLQDFEKMQITAMDRMASYLKEEWKNEICRVINENFESVGKGWLNVQEKSQQIYEVSKLRKFFVTVKYMMEDTLFELVYRSLKAFTEFFEEVTEFTVVVHDMTRVTNTWPGFETDAVEKQPLFTLELVESAGSFGYSTSLAAFEEIIVSLFDRAIHVTKAVPQVEKYVMTQYFWKSDSQGPFLDTVKKEEERVESLRNRLRGCLQDSLAPLGDYVKTYDELLDIAKLDKWEYIHRFEEEEHNTEEMKDEIRKHIKSKKIVPQKIPYHVPVGNFIVDCHHFKLAIASKIQELAKLVLDLIAKMAKDKTHHVRDEFKKVEQYVNRALNNNIEKVVETRQFIGGLPEKMFELKDKIDEMRTFYGILETFQFGLTDEESRQKWDAIAWPKKMDGILDAAEKKLDEESDKAHENMVLDQEKLSKEMERLQRAVTSFSKYSDGDHAAEVAVNVGKLNTDIKQRIAEAREINNKQRMFQEELTPYGLITELEKQFKPYSDLWINTARWQESYQRWTTDPFDTIAPEDLESTVNTVGKVMQQLTKSFNDRPAMLRIVEDVKQKVEAFKPVVPIAIALRNPGMKERHWEALSDKLKMPIIPGETLRTIDFCYQLTDYKDTIISSCEVAAKEYAIEKTLKEMKDKWATFNFHIEKYKDTGTFLLKEAQEVQELLDEHLNLTQQLQFSSFKQEFAEEIDKWEHDLNLIAEILEQWLECQRAWRYLEPIFNSEDIAGQLPRPAKLFEKVDKTWRKIMQNAHTQPNCLDFCLKSTKVLDQFIDSNRSLEQVQKGLNEYLQKKRQAFPRFYFLSDEELLEILSQTKDPRNIDRHLRKLFEFMQKLDWNEKNEMIGFYSEEDEYIPHVKPVPTADTVEIWLTDLQSMMKESVHHQLKLSWEDYVKTHRKQWVLKWAGQVVLAVGQIYWTKDCEDALNTVGHCKEFAGILESQLMDLVDVVQSPLRAVQRINMGGLITIDVHAKDTIDQMARDEINNVGAFDWLKQLRFYFEDDNYCHLKQVDANFLYGGEYLGNTARLVVTPLTDRIYLTLTGALALGLGGAPAGPAGTGKTETTKDLAKALAKQCVVFNCQEGMTYQSTGKFFKGLAWAGAWACFDEFNRIDIEVLSVVAQQVTDLQQACATKQFHLENFEGSTVDVDPTYAIFITMNPGYAGRTELPDNLKVLFRPVACMVPDYALIGEIRLFSFGYKKARNLAQKMVMTFKLSSEQLSSQDHYDFGMRAVNTVIGAAGLNKRDNPDMDEDVLLLRALRDSNIPKFLREDILLFEGIVSDLFPETQLPEVDSAVMTQALEAICVQNNWQAIPEFILKAMQLYDVTVLRHGLMLVGPTGAGKTCVMKLLQQSLTRIAVQQSKGELEDYKPMLKVITHICNPKSITMDQLYGAYDRNTGEWNDGVLCILFRLAAHAEDGCKHWVVFDGPVDALWIESMNTVLDDNKKLCLVSGEIVPMSKDQTMMFEVEDLAVASPATISRCGMIYMEPQTCVPTAARVESWVHLIPKYYESMVDELKELALAYLDPLIEFVRHHLKEYVPSVDNNLVQSCFNMMNSYIQIFNPPPVPKDQPLISPERIEIIKNCNKSLFLLCVVWSVGATCDHESREPFSAKFHELISKNGHEAAFPQEESCYDWCFEYDPNPENEKQPTWKLWEQTQKTFAMKNRLPYFDVMVPTDDTIRQNYVIYHLLTHINNVCVVGPTGTGKSAGVVGMIMRGLPEKFQGLQFTFSAQTSANVLQNALMSKFEKRRMGVYGPMQGKQFVVFVDDTNLPQKEKYGAQPPIELLRQIIGNGGMYNYAPPIKWNNIIDVSFILAMGPAGGGRTALTNRFTRFFNMISFPEMGDRSMLKIFETILHLGFALNKADTGSLNPVLTALVNSTIAIFKKCSKEFVPTPAHVHYSFNLRDISRVFASIYESDLRVVKSKDQVTKMWVHEMYRVFGDRLINTDDRSTLSSFIDEQLKEKLDYDEGQQQLITAPRLIFGDYMVPGADRRVYDEVPDMDILYTRINEYLQTYNDENQSQMNLVMFLDAIDHVSRIARVLRMPNGHCLLLGVGGSGRKSMCRLGAFLSDRMELFTVEITRNYGIKEWHESLARLLLDCGKEDKRLTFLFDDTQILKPSFLEEVASLLTSGDVPNLFEEKDIEQINEHFKPICISEALPTTKISLYARFVKEVRNNLHVCLAFSPIGEVFRERMRMFPSLVNCCTIDWYTDWPAEALASVAASALENTDVDLGSEEMIANVSSMFKTLHLTATEATEKFFKETRRRSYVTPTLYLNLLQNFFELMKQKRDFVVKARARLANGLDKLKETEDRVADLEEQLKAKQPILVQTQEEIKEMMGKLTVDREIAAEKQGVAKKEEAEASKKAEECSSIKQKCANRLAEAEPALLEALKVLKTLKPAQIGELGAYKNPPHGVKYVMEAVCIMLEFGECPKDCYSGAPGMPKEANWWMVAQKRLREPKPLLDILVETYDKERMHAALLNKIKPYIDDPDFTPQKVKDTSLPCMAMCAWVHAMVTWYHVNQEVIPLRESLKKAESELKTVTDALHITQEKLREVTEKVAALEAQYEKALARQKSLEEEVQVTSDKLVRAGRLIDGLGGEKVRWKQLLDQYVADSESIIGDALTAAGTVGYFGPFTSSYRKELLQQWTKSLDQMGIRHSDQADVTSTYGNAVQIQQWQLNGLPTDALSTENAMIMDKARSWPLLIDPQGQANYWIQRTHENDNLQVCKLSDSNYIKTIEGAIRNGYPCLLENIGQNLEPALEPILLKATYNVGGRPHIRIGDSQVAYDPQFRFYMTTKLPNPVYTPEAIVKVALLNFFITPLGLEDQLLGKTVELERPDLEQKKKELTKSNAQKNKELKELQDEILTNMQEAEGDILEDEKLIDNLELSKKKSIEINEDLARAAETEKDIDETRNKYRPHAFRGSLLFFCVSSISAVDPMYQFALQWFMLLFMNGIEKAEKDENLDTRIANLKEYFTYSFYANVCRSLFERHKLMFSFYLCISIIKEDGVLDDNEYRTFLAGATGTGGTTENPSPDWLTEQSWNDIQFFSKNLPAFTGFDTHVANNVDHYKDFFDSIDAHRFPLQGDWETKATPLQRLIIIKCFRADKVTHGVQDFVKNYIGERYIIVPQFNLMDAYKDSNPTTPLIFIISPGSDPMSDLLKFAEQMRMNKKLEKVSLGQGQGGKAKEMVEEGVREGRWVLLQNCHLAGSWMPTLEQIVENFDIETIKREFRLWLTSMPAASFPVSVLQIGVKMTNEPPKGLRANVTKCYFQVKEDELNHPTKPEFFRYLFFSECLLHAVIQERRRYGSLGFNIPYEFNDSDRQVTVSQLRKFLEMYETVPFDVLKFLTGQINYGGRVTDDWDRRCMMTMIDVFLSPPVLEKGYKFSPSGTYSTVEGGSRQYYLDSFAKWPINASPEVFGLHDNADITSARNDTATLCYTVLSMAAGSSSGTAAERDQLLHSSATGIQSKLPDVFDIKQFQAKYPTRYLESMNTVVVQEAVRYNKLLKRIKATLKEFLRALKGETVMSGDLEKLGNSIYINGVPETWSAVGYPSLMPLSSWTVDLVRRCEFIQKWYDNGAPVAFWMGGFFFPQAFLTGTLQNYARQIKQAIDTISFDYNILKEKAADIKQSKEKGNIIYGLIMEGARWDSEGHSIIESRPKELFTDFPPMHLDPIVNRKTATGVYKCPVYKTLTRAGTLSTTGHSTNFVLPIEIPTSVDADHWVKRGVACVLGLNF